METLQHRRFSPVNIRPRAPTRSIKVFWCTLVVFFDACKKASWPHLSILVVLCYAMHGAGKADYRGNHAQCIQCMCDELSVKYIGRFLVLCCTAAWTRSSPGARQSAARDIHSARLRASSMHKQACAGPARGLISHATRRDMTRRTPSIHTSSTRRRTPSSIRTASHCEFLCATCVTADLRCFYLKKTRSLYFMYSLDHDSMCFEHILLVSRWME